MIEENRAKFFNVSLRVPLEQVLPQGYKGLIVISLNNHLSEVASQQRSQNLSEKIALMCSLGRSSLPLFTKMVKTRVGTKLRDLILKYFSFVLLHFGFFCSYYSGGDGPWGEFFSHSKVNGGAERQNAFGRSDNVRRKFCISTNSQEIHYL